MTTTAATAQTLPPPVGRTSSRWYATGYQQALQDIKASLAEGGEDAAAEWIENNTTRLRWLDHAPVEPVRLRV